MIQKKYIINPTLKIELTEEDINDILFTALNGGVDHWCRNVTAAEELQGGDLCEQLTRGGTLIFIPCMDIAPRELALCDFLLGMRRYLEWECHVSVKNNRINTYEDISEDDADAIIQFALFGEYNWRRK